SPALVGYLSVLSDSSDESAFDEFLGSPRAAALTDYERLFLVVRGPATPAARQRIDSLVQTLSVVEGTRGLFGWQRNVSAQKAKEFLHDWLPRIASQVDYNSLVDWMSLQLHDLDTPPEEMRSDLFELISMRTAYPEIGQQQWEWTRLAEGFVATDALTVAQLV